MTPHNEVIAGKCEMNEGKYSVGYLEPKVSIIIPVYNGADFIREAIESALAQVYRNIEILVVNDGSNDSGATERAVKAYGDRVKYFKKKNGGVAAALNFAITKMTGDYFSWLSHDDLYYPDKIASQIHALRGMDSAKTILYSDYELLFDDEAKTLQKVLLPATPPEQFRYFITANNSLNGCTLLVPASAFNECGGFNEKLRTTQDYDLWFRMAEKYKFVHVPEVLVKFRQHFGQGTVQMKKTVLIECNALLAGFVSKLSEAEITAATHKSMTHSYMGISTNLWQRGFNQAGWHAAGFAFKSLSRSSPAEALKFVMLLLKAKLVSNLFRMRASSIRFLYSINMLNVIKKLFFPERHLQSEENLKNRFSKIYFQNIFGGKVSRSGSGSDMVQTAEIRRELPKLIQEYGIRTFMDAPCGDLHWMKETALNVGHYIGVDIVGPLIEKNRKAFGKAGTSFLCLDLAKDELPQADIIFCRDCLVHLTYDEICKVIANFKRSNSTYLLTTTFTDRRDNIDLVLENIWRPLNLEMPPFNFPKPLKLINEKCTEDNNQYTDKSLGLWRLDEIN